MDSDAHVTACGAGQDSEETVPATLLVHFSSRSWQEVSCTSPAFSEAENALIEHAPMHQRYTEMMLVNVYRKRAIIR